MERPILGFTIGDPAGAGPEICIKALNKESTSETCRPVLYGDERVMRRAMGIVAPRMELRRIDDPREYRDGVMNLVSLDNLQDAWDYAKVQASCGKAAFGFIVRAIEDAKADKIAGVVTGPINKESMNLAGIHYAGMTEIFADLTNTTDYSMMLTGGPLKVIHVSTHVSMLRAIETVTKQRVLTVIRLADRMLRDLGYAHPRIGVAGLNAHAGEHGLFGNEEIEQITPAIEAAQADGLDVTGPVPPDTVFVKAVNGMFDIVVVMYHDQGHIPLKLLDFMGGVNVTVGIPIIRTSVDHGTVFGKAGKGTADETSMLKAIELGVQFATHRRSEPANSRG